MIDLAEIKSRINPAYQDVRGTESHERKMFCDEIERLREQIATQKAYYESVFEDGARRIAELTEQRDKLLAAAKSALDWDKRRKYIMPYRVREPLIAAVIDSMKGR